MPKVGGQAAGRRRTQIHVGRRAARARVLNRRFDGHQEKSGAYPEAGAREAVRRGRARLAAAGEAERAQPLDEALDAVARAAAIAPPSPAKRSRESEIAAALALEAAAGAATTRPRCALWRLLLPRPAG